MIRKSRASQLRGVAAVGGALWLNLVACSGHSGTSAGMGMNAQGSPTQTGATGTASNAADAGNDSTRAGSRAGAGGRASAAGSGGQARAGAGAPANSGSPGMAGHEAAGQASGGSNAPAADGGDGFYQMERLRRGVVALPGAGGIYVGWRMFGTEYDPEHADRAHYELYRDGTMIADVKDSTNYLDAAGNDKSEYSVRAIIDGERGEPSEGVKPWAQNYLRIPLQPPGSNYSANDASAADVDGDGDYELVLKWDPNDSKDNSQSGVTSDVYLDTLELDGTRLARIDLGPNIRAGAHYTQFIVFDFDGDGKAEIAVKTAPGTKRGDGKYLALGPAANDDDSKLYRNADGYILTGPEYLTVFSAATGEELATVNFDVPRGRVSDWGDDYGHVTVMLTVRL